MSKVNLTNEIKQELARFVLEMRTTRVAKALLEKHIGISNKGIYVGVGSYYYMEKNNLIDSMQQLIRRYGVSHEIFHTLDLTKLKENYLERKRILNKRTKVQTDLEDKRNKSVRTVENLKSLQLKFTENNHRFSLPEREAIGLNKSLLQIQDLLLTEESEILKIDSKINLLLKNKKGIDFNSAQNKMEETFYSVFINEFKEIVLTNLKKMFPSNKIKVIVDRNEMLNSIKIHSRTFSAKPIGNLTPFEQMLLSFVEKDLLPFRIEMNNEKGSIAIEDGLINVFNSFKSKHSLKSKAFEIRNKINDFLNKEENKLNHLLLLNYQEAKRLLGTDSIVTKEIQLQLPEAFILTFNRFVEQLKIQEKIQQENQSIITQNNLTAKEFFFDFEIKQEEKTNDLISHQLGEDYFEKYIRYISNDSFELFL